MLPTVQTVSCTGIDASPPLCVMEPVNSLTGSFTDSATDLGLPGYGVPFAFKRSYASNDSDIGRFGSPGWRDNFSAFLVIDQATGNVSLHSENGQVVQYTKQQDGSFVGASPGILSSLASVSGGYDLTRHDQTVLHFNGNGRLLSIKGRNGKGLTLSYNGLGQLATITDAPGRVVTLGYDLVTGLLTSVATPDGRRVSYGYNGSNQLATVTDVRGKVWTYAYDGAGRLASLLDPNGHYRYRNT